MSIRNMAYGCCLSLEYSYEVFTGQRFKDDWDYIYKEFQQTVKEMNELYNK